MNKTNHQNSRYILLSEYLFILVPFIVIAIVKAYTNSLQTFLAAPDWSFAASILWGQTIVKLVSGGSSSNDVIWQRITMIISAIFVLGLIPSLVILTLILISTTAPSFLVYLQLLLFSLATLIFFMVGSAGQILLDESDKKSND